MTLLLSHSEVKGEAGLETGESVGDESDGVFEAKAEVAGGQALEDGGETESETGEETGAEAGDGLGGELLEMLLLEFPD